MVSPKSTKLKQVGYGIILDEDKAPFVKGRKLKGQTGTTKQTAQTRQTVTALAALALDDAFRLAFCLSLTLYYRLN